MTLQRKTPLRARAPLKAGATAKPKKPTTAKAPRKKKCRNTECKAEFVPIRLGQRGCSIACALVLGRAEQARQAQRAEQEQCRRERVERRERRQRLKGRGDYLRDLQQAFNAWIRARDYAEPCISCGRHHAGQYHAGHYRTVGSSPELRFEPLNVHKQCAPCNNHKSGDIVNYRLNLVRKLGADAVAWLEGPHAPQRYSIEQLQELTRDYRAKARELQRAREGGAASVGAGI